jgi:hypothetical protein
MYTQKTSGYLTRYFYTTTINNDNIPSNDMEKVWVKMSTPTDVNEALDQS